MKRYIAAILLSVVVFGGINNLREITDIAIVEAIGLDYDEDSGKYKASVVVMDTKDEEKSKKIIYKAEGESVQSAIRNTVDKSPKRLYLAHMETLIIDEKIAKEKMMDALDFFIRDNEGSNNFYLLISRDSLAEDVIEIVEKEEISIKSLIESSSKYKGNSNFNTLNDNIKDILKVGKEACVNSCSIEDEKIQISSMAYFKDWTMQGYLTEKESVIYNLVTNNLENTIITIGKEDYLCVFEIIGSNTKIKINENLDNKEKIQIEVKLDTIVSESGKNISLQTKEEIEQVQNEIANKVKEDIASFLEKQDLDLIGIGNLKYKENKSNLENDYEITVDVNIQNQGGVMKKW